MIRSRGRTQPIPPHERRVRGTCPQVRLIARQALANIVTQCGSGGQRAWAAFRHPESWELVTQHSWREIAYVVTWDIIAVGTMIWALFGSSVPGVSDWARFVTMAVCATVYLVFTRRYEESRRSRAVGPHIDVTSVWTFAGLVVLPTPLALGLILIIRGQRWFAARRPLYRFIFSTCNMVTAALLTKLVFQSVGGMVGGVRTNQYTENGHRYYVMVQVDPKYQDMKTVRSLLVNNSVNNLVPLSQVTQEKQVDAMQSITRIDRQRAITIFANPGAFRSIACSTPDFPLKSKCTRLPFTTTC